MCVFFTLSGLFTRLHPARLVILRGTLVNRAYGGDKNLYVDSFLLTIFGPIYFRPP